MWEAANQSTYKMLVLSAVELRSAAYGLATKKIKRTGPHPQQETAYYLGSFLYTPNPKLIN
jgi:hypothetical protein